MASKNNSSKSEGCKYIGARANSLELAKQKMFEELMGLETNNAVHGATQAEKNYMNGRVK